MAAVKPIKYKMPTMTGDGTGGTLESYAIGETDFAEVSNLNEKMEIVAQQQAEGTLMLFKVWYRESLGINEDWLINYEGKDFKITGITKEGERNFKYKITGKHIG